MQHGPTPPVTPHHPASPRASSRGAVGENKQDQQLGRQRDRWHPDGCLVSVFVNGNRSELKGGLSFTKMTVGGFLSPVPAADKLAFGGGEHRCPSLWGRGVNQQLKEFRDEGERSQDAALRRMSDQNLPPTPRGGHGRKTEMRPQKSGGRHVRAQPPRSCVACRWLGQGCGVPSHWGRGGLCSARCLYYLPTASPYYETNMTIKQTPMKTGNVWRPGDRREARHRHG